MEPDALTALIHVDLEDPGCKGGGILDVYVELEATGGDASRLFPGWAAHLRSCPGCRGDYEGLLEAVRLYGDGDESPTT
jgi:hypothetical protein